MKVYSLLSILIVVCTIASCNSSPSNERPEEPRHYELTSDDENALTEVLTDMREELKLDSNYIMICNYCTARVVDEDSVCDSCGLVLPELGAPMLSIDQINAFEMACCMTCGILIPDEAAACKYCMAIQPINE